MHYANHFVRGHCRGLMRQNPLKVGAVVSMIFSWRIGAGLLRGTRQDKKVQLCWFGGGRGGGRDST